ncbi:cell wall protein DAN4-like isoform X1 [Xiphophorus couchianus]|uniref:cell wall protein DAN4-like isoform X1 n=1 Tax=Xiphophorus couchianus TaxID=32473 RepID=UPI0010167FD2|nr:cell wall protein DAN4-like isoform X1 [Xiphophorus couchianus]
MSSTQNQTTAYQTIPATNATPTNGPPAPVFYVGVVVYEPFDEDLKDNNTQTFKDLAKRIVAVYDMLYRKAFGALFVRSYVISFRVSLTSRIRMNVTEVEVGVEFNQTTPLVELPRNEEVQKTLSDAIDKSNNNTIMDVPFSPGSVQIIRTPLPTTPPTTNSTDTTISPNSTATTAVNPTTNTTTPSTEVNSTTNTTTPSTAVNPTTNTTTPSTAVNPTTNTTTPSAAVNPTTNTTTPSTEVNPTTNTTTPSTAVNPTTKTTAPSTAVNPTTKTTPTVEATVTRKVTFRSLGETFTTDLLNPSSAAFKNRAALLKSNLEPLFQRTFSTLRDFTVTSFSNGSIINNMNLKFSAAFVPSNIQIAEVLLKAALNVTDFNIETASFLVDDIQVSSGVSHNISLITALSLVLLSWLLSNQQ